MATKIIYLTVGNKQEQVEFRSTDSIDEVRDTFRAAAEAGPHDVLKLYNNRGSIVNISPKLPDNTPDSKYRLEVVATYIDDLTVDKSRQEDIRNIERRLEDLEKLILVDAGTIPHEVHDMKLKIQSFNDKLEGIEHLSWLGLFKDISSGTSLQPFWNKKATAKQDEASYQHVYDRFMKMSKVDITEEVKEYLCKPTFDNWQWDDAEMLMLLRQMFIDLKFTTKFNIEMDILHNWLFEVYHHYNAIPFHNFKHCFMVTQMMYGLIQIMDLPKKLSDLEVLILLTSSICHDLDHPGYNNAYQVNAHTELALRYNDTSPLENHHCAVTFEILENSSANIFKNVPPEGNKKIREGIIRCILGTDMAKHCEILSSFKKILPDFDLQSKDHIDMLLVILVKVADISNEARPMEVSEPWLNCLLEEFFNQGDTEKMEGLPVGPFMDREKVTKPMSQIGFIEFILLPLFEALAQLFPIIEEHIVVSVRNALKYYTDMHDALEREKEQSFAS